MKPEQIQLCPLRAISDTKPKMFVYFQSATNFLWQWKQFYRNNNNTRSEWIKRIELDFVDLSKKEIHFCGCWSTIQVSSNMYNLILFEWYFNCIIENVNHELHWLGVWIYMIYHLQSSSSLPSVICTIQLFLSHIEFVSHIQSIVLHCCKFVKIFHEKWIYHNILRLLDNISPVSLNIF